MLERTSLDPQRVDEVVLGRGYPNGEAPGLGRVAALDAGLSVSVPVSPSWWWPAAPNR